MATILVLKLEEVLGPSVRPKPARAKREQKPPRSVTRVPEVQAKLNFGKQLLALRATTPGNTALGKLVRKQFDIPQSEATEAMRVARLYGQRWEITSRLFWAALVDLSSPSITAAARHRLEEKIVAGTHVGGPEIRRTRVRLKNGRSRRQNDAPPLSAGA
jgi:hypothetical protein